MREICNAWKSDSTIASVARSVAIAKTVSSLMGWTEGARLAQDSVLWKPPKVKYPPFQESINSAAAQSINSAAAQFGSRDF